MLIHKANKKKLKNLEPTSFGDLPLSCLIEGGKILHEKNGEARLRARNDMIHSELVEYSHRVGSKLDTRRHGDEVWFIMPHISLTVRLLNSRGK